MLSLLPSETKSNKEVNVFIVSVEWCSSAILLQQLLFLQVFPNHIPWKLELHAE